MAFVSEYYNNATKFTLNNKGYLVNDNLCGCYNCLKIFSPKLINQWIKDENGTAICPYCNVDSVIGESSGYPITREFLSDLRRGMF